MCVTSVVDISGDLYVTLLCVDWQFIEVFIWLQKKFSSKRQWVSILINCVDQHGVIVLKLDGEIADDDSTKLYF